MGRTRKPTALKILHGTHRPWRDGNPKLEPGERLTKTPKAPVRLGKAGRKVWREVMPEMVAYGYVTELDLPAFEHYCRTHDEVARIDKLLSEQGEFYTTEKGCMCSHPAVRERFHWLDMMRRYEIQFWLTPTSRAGKVASSPNRGGIVKRTRPATMKEMLENDR